jgi:hypothetical protein
MHWLQMFICTGISYFLFSQCILLKCRGNFSVGAKGTRAGRSSWATFTVNDLRSSSSLFMYSRTSIVFYMLWPRFFHFLKHTIIEIGTIYTTSIQIRQDLGVILHVLQILPAKAGSREVI